MHTRLRNNIRKPRQYIDGAIQYSTEHRAFSIVVAEPPCHTEALQDQKWCQAMDDEYPALLKNKR